MNEINISTEWLKIDSLNENKNRINEMFWGLIWKKFKNWEKIQMIYKSPGWKNIIKYKFDTSTNKVFINNRIFTIKPLEWMKIKTIEFTNDKIIIKWILWIVDWKIEATYIDTLKAIDTIYNYVNKNK